MRTASSSIATMRSRPRTSACTRSARRLPPIVRVAYAPKRSRSRATTCGHEAQRVELRVGVRQGGAGLAALVDDEVHVRGARVRAHPLAPRPDRRVDLLGREIGERRDGVGRVHDHLVLAPGGERRVQVGRGGRLGVRGVRGQRGVEVGHRAHPPAGRVRLAPVGAQRLHLGRRLPLVAGREGIALGVDGRRRARPSGPRSGAPARSPATIARSAGERIDADLSQARAPCPRARSRPPGRACRPRCSRRRGRGPRRTSAR